MILISIFISNLTGFSAGYIFILSAYFITKNGIQLIQNSFFGGREAASSCPALLHAVHIYFIVLTNKLYFIVIKSAFSSDICFADFSYVCKSAFSSNSCFADFSYVCKSAFSSNSYFADFFCACKSAFSSDSCFADFFCACKSAFLSDSCFADFLLQLQVGTCMIL